MEKLLLIGGAVLMLLQGLSIILHMVGASKVAAIDDKVVQALQKLGVGPQA